MSNQTSLITILSSTHGRLRREQRDLDKRDLQKALKYGTRTKVWNGRWRFEYDGIVFITDKLIKKEITSYPAPLAEAPETSADRLDHINVKKILDMKPHLSTSHTVLVVDTSGSMNTHDIHLHRDRRSAAYSNMALELIAEQLFQGNLNNRDVVSLVEFNKSASIVFSREPISWVGYNKLLRRRDNSRFVDREVAMLSDEMNCDSNYLPALEKAELLLAEKFHEECALNVFFLSDGAPTDSQHLGLTPVAVERRVFAVANRMARTYGNNLTLMTVGFGSKLRDFSVLQKMSDVVLDNKSGAKADFIFCAKFANAIGGAVTSSVTSMTETRTSLMEGKSNQYTKRKITPESAGRKDMEYFVIDKHYTFDPKNEEWIRHRGLPRGCLREGNLELFENRCRNVPPLLAVCSKHCGEGAERVAFRCRLADARNEKDCVLGEMVAKETLSVERLGENKEFHRGFIETQSLAASLAAEFNKRLQGLPDYNTQTTPRIHFLDCSVLIVEDSRWATGIRGFLVEKMLDTKRYAWTKWNNNAGAVDGKYVHKPLNVDVEFARLQDGFECLNLHDGIIEEGSEEEEDEDSDNEESLASLCSPSDYLQAFTHFTYRFTNKKVMVCDLQGIYKDDAAPPVFELSDPAIHYASNKRCMVFGRTDKGQKGMQRFFDTHKCCKVCKLLQLSAKSKTWRKDWHEGDWLANATNPNYV